MVPEVEVLHLPVETAVENRDRLASCGWFDTPTVSAEDSQRGALYAAEAQRAQLRSGASDMASYYRSLEMELEIRFADEFTTPRIAQLTQKTNQFNLTTRRYTDVEIRGFAASASADVFSLRLRDRFGDAGIVGVAILEYREGAARIDTLLLSCRVLGRRVEDAMLDQCIRLARARGCRRLTGEYRPTAKNSQVREFYSSRGFAGDGDLFELDLEGELPGAPDVFRKIDSELSGEIG
jgi:FkbH-like protein